MNIKGAIFDVDGTLLDSMPIWQNVGEDYLKSKGIAPVESINERFQSMSMQQAAAYYRDTYSLSDTNEEIARDINTMVEHFYLNSAVLKRGVFETLSRLSVLGVRMCVATATDRYLVENALKRNGINDFFSEIFTCSSVGAGKDNPLIFDRALSLLETPKSETYIFEDALYAISTAKSAGYKVVAVYDKSMDKSKDEISRLADIYINSMDEMRNLI